METISVKKYIVSAYSVHKNKILFVLKILIAGGLLTYIATSIKIPELIRAFNKADYFLISIAFVLVIPNILLQYWKWKLTCKSILGYDDRRTILFSLLQGFSAGAFTPFRVGEYFGRAFQFKEKTLLEVTIATLIDKFFPLFIVASIGSLSSIIFIYFFYNVSAFLAAALFVVVFAVFYLLIQLLIDPEFWDNFLFNKIKKSKVLNKYFSRFRVLKNLDRTYSLKMFLLSFLFYLCFVTQFVVLVSAFTNQFNLIDYFWSVFLIIFAKTFFPAI